MTDRKLDRNEFKTLAKFRFQLRKYLHFSEQAAHSIGLTSQWYTALLYLKGLNEGEATTIGMLADQLMIKHNSAVELVDRLVAKGLVTRAPSNDRNRRVFVVITKEGEDMLEQLADIHREELERIGAELRQLLRELVNKAD